MKNKFKVFDELSLESTFFNTIEEAYKYASNIEGVIVNVKTGRSYSCDHIHSLKEATKAIG